MKPDFEVHCAQCGKIVLIKRKKFLDKTRDGRRANFFCNEDCQSKFKKTGTTISCANCGTLIYKQKSEIESGNRLFCSTSCAATFNNSARAETTKGKTKILNCANCNKEYIGAVNTPISTGLCSECKNAPFERECKVCFCKIYGSYAIKYCSPCRSKIYADKNRSRIVNGTLFSKSIKCEYVFHSEKIRCDSKLEFVCLKYFQLEYDVLDMKRANIVLRYFLHGKSRSYHPDFQIILKDGSKYLIECKGVVGKKLNDKWNDYNEKSIEKKKVLEKWCQENNYIPFWFDQQQNDKIYKSTKIDM